MPHVPMPYYTCHQGYYLPPPHEHYQTHYHWVADPRLPPHPPPAAAGYYSYPPTVHSEWQQYHGQPYLSTRLPGALSNDIEGNVNHSPCAGTHDVSSKSKKSFHSSHVEASTKPVEPPLSSREHFPGKLYTMLELVSSGSLVHYSDAVLWLPHGRAFKVLDQERFMKYVVPMFFRQTKIRSFHRQLYLWGYERVSHGKDCGAWYHKYFTRDSPQDVARMKRIKIKNTEREPVPAHLKNVAREANDKYDPKFSGLPGVQSSVVPVVKMPVKVRSMVSDSHNGSTASNVASNEKLKLLGQWKIISSPSSMSSTASRGIESPPWVGDAEDDNNDCGTSNDLKVDRDMSPRKDAQKVSQISPRKDAQKAPASFSFDKSTKLSNDREIGGLKPSITSAGLEPLPFIDEVPSFIEYESFITDMIEIL